MLALLLALTLSSPVTSRSAWMSPDAFHLAMGMSRERANQRLKSDGWDLDHGKNNDLIVKYDDKRTVTLAFTRNRLHSIRFELVDFIPDIEKAYREREQSLTQHYGRPHAIAGDTTLLQYDRTMPNIHVVRSTDRASSFGIQGLGFLVVRYFDPAVK